MCPAVKLYDCDVSNDGHDGAVDTGGHVSVGVGHDGVGIRSSAVSAKGHIQQMARHLSR